MSTIFISYRRSDSADVVGRIYEHVIKRFGAEHVFKDVESIRGGADFRDSINEALDKSDFLLAIIGPAWLSTTDSSGNRQIDDPGDFVRLEVETGLKKDLLVIPTLVSGAAMPTEDELPDALKQLAFRNAKHVRVDPDFVIDVGRLCDAIDPDGTTKAEEHASSVVPPMPNVFQNRSVSIGGSVTGGAIVTGDHNVTQITFTQTTLPDKETVDIKSAVSEVADLLGQLQSPDGKKIRRALADVEDELSESEPDREEIGAALNRALKYAKDAEGFAELTTKLKAPMPKVVSWLGDEWEKLLTVVGLKL
jgi:hypothetical protein